MLAKVCEGNGECSAVESTPNTDYKTTCGDEIERVKMLNLGYLILDETQLIVLICQQIIEMELVKGLHGSVQRTVSLFHSITKVLI
jgi:hypothetical protein